MYYNLSMYFPVDGLLWLVVIFLLFQKCWGWHSWTFSGAELVRSRAVTLFSFIRFWETPHHSLSPTPPHHSADHLPSTPLQYSVLSGSFFGWSDGSETCLSVDAVEVKHLFKGLLTILFHAWHFSYLEALFFILRNLTWGLSVLWSSQRTSFSLCQSFLFSVALPCHQFLLLIFLPSTFSIFAVALCLISWVGCLACRLKKDVRLESCELSFICGEMRIAAQEAASQIALRICSEATVGKSQYIRFWWRAVEYHEVLILQKAFC